VFAAKYSRETAVQKCREAVKRSPWDPMTWGYLAVSLDHRGEPDRAAIAFKLAMRHMRAPDISIFFNFGVFLARHRRYDKARQMFSAILKVDPENTRAEEYLEEIDDILRRMARGKPAS
jgi:Tfp pilus assembly protein PilF